MAKHHRLALEIIWDKVTLLGKMTYLNSKAIVRYHILATNKLPRGKKKKEFQQWRSTAYMERSFQKLLVLICETLSREVVFKIYTVCFVGHVLFRNKGVYFSPQRAYVPSINHYKHYTLSLRWKETP